MIEVELEKKLVGAIKAVCPAAVVYASRIPASEVKMEESDSAVNTIALSVSVRQHDNFELPFVNFNCALSLDTRADLNPSGSAHEETLGAIVDLLSSLHADGGTMSRELSVPGLFSAAIMLGGSSGKSYDRAAAVWTEDLTFTVRGSLI